MGSSTLGSSTHLNSGVSAFDHNERLGERVLPRIQLGELAAHALILPQLEPVLNPNVAMTIICARDRTDPYRCAKMQGDRILRVAKAY